MKKLWSKVVAVICAVAIAVAPSNVALGLEAADANPLGFGFDMLTAQESSLTTQDTSSGEMVASNQKYKKISQGKGRIDSFTLDNKFNYTSLGNDDGKSTFTLSTTALQNVVKDKLLPGWSGVAASVFRDQANQLVDLYGYENNKDTMTQKGFDAYFNMTASGNKKYVDETWSCYNLKSKLEQTYATHAGDPGWDQFTVSGVKQISNLAQARNMVGQALIDCQGNNKPFKQPSEFLDEPTEDGSTRLEGLDDDSATTGFANVVTAVNCKGASSEFDYVQFGIAFYDFEAVPVAADNLVYVTGGFNNTGPEPKGEQNSTIENGQQQEIMHSAQLGDDVKETTSTSLSALAGAQLDQSIGANIGWSQTEWGEDTSFEGGDGDDPLSISSSGWSEQTSMGLNWGAAWKMAGAAGAEVGHSVENQISKSVSTTVALPAHTSANITHATTKTSYTQQYQQPVILNYKVALFTMSGDYSTAGGGGINGGIYDKQSFVIKLDTKDDAFPSYGCAATDDLYSRVFTNKWIADYDTSAGRTYNTHSTASGWSKSSDIDWQSVINYVNSARWGNVEDVAKNNYFYETPGKLSVDRDTTKSSVGDIYPLFGLSKVTTPTLKYKLYSNDTLNRESLSVSGLNRFNVPFYGFDSKWGEWNRCDENGTIINGGYLLNDDPVSLVGTDTLTPKSGTRGGTIYLTWKIEDTNAKPITGESPDGQDLMAANITSPVVEIEVVDSALYDPAIWMSGDTYAGFYKTPVVLNTAMDYQVTDKTDKIIGTQVKWESRELDGDGIHVDEDTSVATFTRPGTYHVRPYVINNSNEKVFPVKVSGDNVDYQWFTINVTAHDLVHCDAQPATCTADGCIEHYRCSDCGKYFSDADAENEIADADVRIESTGHAWGEWTTTSQATTDTPGEQRRVCSNDASHEETRGLYTVQFNWNGQQGTTDSQVIPAGASLAVPTEPKVIGSVFEGWYTDQSCTTPYDFGAGVTANMTLYAKWSTAKYMIAAMAVGDTYTDQGEEKLASTVNGSISIEGGSKFEDRFDAQTSYTYYYKEVELGESVTLTVKPNSNYGLKTLEAAPVDAEAKLGTPFTPDKVNATTYTFTAPASDVAVVASFAQVKITYDANAPEGATVTNMPTSPAEYAYGAMPTQPENPTATVTGNNSLQYRFNGWYTDAACTKPYSFMAPLTQDLTLYAGWDSTAGEYHTVQYTLAGILDSTSSTYSSTYTVKELVKNGETAPDPTADLNKLMQSLPEYTGYELYHNDQNKYWFTDQSAYELAYDFEKKITGNTTHLYAKIVPKLFTVSFNNYDEATSESTLLKYEKVAYGGTITQPEVSLTKEGYTFDSKWTTLKGDEWDNTNGKVYEDLDLYAKWDINHYTVTYDANGQGTAPAAQTNVEYNTTTTEPTAPTEDGYTFAGWYTDSTTQTDEKKYDFTTPVTADITLYAKWDINHYTVTYDANGHGTAPAAQTGVEYNATITAPNEPTAEGYKFCGWYTNAYCTEGSNWDFSNNTVKGDTTLYAKWTPEEYKVSFSALQSGCSMTASLNGTDSAGEPPYKVPYGTTVMLKAQPSSNYGLQTIYARYASGDEIVYLTLQKVDANSYTFVMPAADVTVDATFGQITVSFDTNAPSDTTASAAPASQAIAYGSTPTQPADPTLTSGASDYVFACWCTDEACTTPYLFTPLKENKTLYAKWVRAGSNRTVTYTLFDIPGSTPSSYRTTDTVFDGSKAYDPTASIIELIAGLPEYYVGYELYADASGNQWFTDANYTEGFSFETAVTADTQLYAKIVPKTYTVTYYSEKGDTTPLTTASIDHGTAIGDNAPKPAKEGYTLNGWKNKDDDASWDLSAPVTADGLALYADWAKNSYSVTFDNQGHGAAVDAKTVQYGDKVKEPDDLTETGYTFGGWFTDAECTQAYDFNATTMGASDLKLYAGWSKSSFNVAFNTNGAGIGPDAQTVEYGGLATDPGALSIVGYTFAGWYTNSSCTNKYDFSTPVTSDLTLYAKWAVTVTFDANGHGTAPASQTIEYGTQATQPDDLKVSGYTFGGWFTDRACTTAYDFGSSVLCNITLYAKWTGPSVTSIAMYRLYNPNSGEHFYTAGAGERDVLRSVGWSYEGVAWNAPSKSNTPVYRLYNPYAGDHHYTTSASERDHLASVGWRYEGVGWYSADSSITQGTKQTVYRLYNPNAYTGAHHYTMSASERDHLASVGWRYEGIGWYGFTLSASSGKSIAAASTSLTAAKF